MTRFRLTRGLLEPRLGGLRIGLAPGGGAGFCAPVPGAGTPLGAFVFMLDVMTASRSQAWSFSSFRRNDDASQALARRFDCRQVRMETRLVVGAIGACGLVGGGQRSVRRASCKSSSAG